MFDNGVAEQDDLKAAILYLNNKGFENIYLAGYSFGANINSLVVSKGCEICDHIMVSPPMKFFNFDDIEKMPCTGLVITGDNDDIAPVHLIDKALTRWGINPRYEIIDNCDHFYLKRLDALKSVLIDYLSKLNLVNKKEVL